MMHFGRLADIFRLARGAVRLLRGTIMVVIPLIVLLGLVVSLFVAVAWFVAVPVVVGTARLVVWWYPRRGLSGARMKQTVRSRPAEPQGVLRYEDWPPG